MIDEFRPQAEEAFYKSAPNHAAFSLQYHEGTFADPRASVSVGWYMEHDGKHYNAYDEIMVIAASPLSERIVESAGRMGEHCAENHALHQRGVVRR